MNNIEGVGPSSIYLQDRSGLTGKGNRSRVTPELGPGHIDVTSTA